MNPTNTLPEIDAMRAGVNYRHNIKVRNFTITVRPITMTEDIEIAAEVVKLLAAMPKEFRNAKTEHAFMARETLKRASCPEPGVYQPGVGDPVLDKMTNDEMIAFFKEYVAVTDKCNPCLELLTKDELMAIVEAVKKNKESPDLVYQLTELSFLQLVSLAHYLITSSD